MRALALARVAAAALVGAVPACRQGATSAPGTDGGAAAASAEPPRPAAATADLQQHAHDARDRALLPCRIIALDGKVALEGDLDAGHAGLLAAEQPLPQGWLVLGEGVRLVGKDPRTTRETTFLGPGRARDCVGGAEEAWVAQGSFESTGGAGEAPGAEEWVVTPNAVLRYASAKLRVGVRAASTTVTMVAGVAFIWPPARADAGSLDEGWQRLGAGETTAAPREGLGQAVDHCVDLAGRARNLTAALFSTGGGAPSGATVTDQVTTRRLARAACALAELRAESFTPAGTPSADGGGWASRLAAADAAWRSLPLPGAAPASP
jgi:hypothetical protein